MIIVWILIFTFSACVVIVVFARLFPNKPKKTVVGNNEDCNKVYNYSIYQLLHLYAMSKAYSKCRNINPNCYFDEQLEEVAKFVILSQGVQTSIIQQKFSMDELRADNIQAQLEMIGILSAMDEKSQRKVLVKDVHFFRKPISQILTENSEEINRMIQWYESKIYNEYAKKAEATKETRKEYRVPISELKGSKQLYKIGNDVIDRITSCILRGEEFVTLSKEEYDFLQLSEEARKENEEYDKKYELICDTRLKAIELEKSAHIQEAIDTYIANIKQCNSDPRFDNYQNTGYDINRVIILLSKTKQYDLLRQILEFNINKYPDYAANWKFRLEKLNNPKPDIIMPEREDIAGIIESNKDNSIGKQIHKYKLSLPEFDFYRNLPEGLPTNLYEKLPNTHEIGKRLMEYRDALRIIEHEAYTAEQTGDYKTAIKAYERMIKEECEDSLPYERLMILYKKIGWKDYEKSVIKRGILFFSSLKNRQKEYVMTLARKYGMEHKALEYINSNKKIFYYMGVFELYNPYPIIQKWEDRLNKL